MALETQDDYQDKIDDLMKEVEKLYDEGTDKGFKLKREEEMEQEERALETEKDYQKAWNDMYEQTHKYKKQVNKLAYDINELEQKIKTLSKQKVEAQKLLDESDKELVKIFNEGKKKGFDVKRSEETDFESRKNSILADITDLDARKQEVLNSLEERAKLKQQKDGETIGKNAVKIIDDCYEQAHAAKSKARNEGKTAIRAIEKVISDIRTLTKDGKDIDGDFDLTILQRYIDSIENGIKAMDTI